MRAGYLEILSKERNPKNISSGPFCVCLLCVCLCVCGFMHIFKLCCGLVKLIYLVVSEISSEIWFCGFHAWMLKPVYSYWIHPFWMIYRSFYQCMSFKLVEFMENCYYYKTWPFLSLYLYCITSQFIIVNKLWINKFDIFISNKSLRQRSQNRQPIAIHIQF